MSRRCGTPPRRHASDPLAAAHAVLEAGADGHHACTSA
jgi:hypothetical protein